MQEPSHHCSHAVIHRENSQGRLSQQCHIPLALESAIWAALSKGSLSLSSSALLSAGSMMAEAEVEIF